MKRKWALLVLAAALLVWPAGVCAEESLESPADGAVAEESLESEDAVGAAEADAAADAADADAAADAADADAAGDSETAIYGDDAELAELDYDSLYALKVRVDAELYSRPEAEPVYWAAGSYVAGRDIQPGRYYLIMSAPTRHSYTSYRIYATQADYEEGNDYLTGDLIFLTDEPVSISLEDGNCLSVQGPVALSVAPFTEDERYRYTAPEGTLVPAGVYEVGENADIPVGTYLAYPATLSGGDIKLYSTMAAYESDGSWHLGYDTHYELDVTADLQPETIRVSEGMAVLVEKDVIMKKQAALVFE